MNSKQNNSTAATLARGWIEAWQRMDINWLQTQLASEFVHDSPFGQLRGRDHYLEVVEPLARRSVQELVIVDLIAGTDRAAIYFENHTPQGVVPSCDWVTVRDGLIVSIRSFYDTVAIRDVLPDDDQEALDD